MSGLSTNQLQGLKNWCFVWCVFLTGGSLAGIWPVGHSSHFQIFVGATIFGYFGTKQISYLDVFCGWSSECFPDLQLSNFLKNSWLKQRKGLENQVQFRKALYQNLQKNRLLFITMVNQKCLRTKWFFKLSIKSQFKKLLHVIMKENPDSYLIWWFWNPSCPAFVRLI